MWSFDAVWVFVDFTWKQQRMYVKEFWGQLLKLEDLKSFHLIESFNEAIQTIPFVAKY